MMVLMQDQLGVLGEIIALIGPECLSQNHLTKGLDGEISNALLIECAPGQGDRMRAGQGELGEGDNCNWLERLFRAARGVSALAGRSARGVFKRNGLGGDCG